MKRIIWMLGIVIVVVVLRVAPGFGSQTVGTALYTDPGIDARIRNAPLPEGYKFGRALPPSIDLEVEWKPIGDPDFYRSIRGIFIDRRGRLRVVDIHTRAIRGMRVWLSKDGGKSWRIEQETGNATRETMKQMLGQEKADVIFHHRGTNLFKIWPLEAKALIKTEFRGLYEQRAHMSSGRRVFLAQDLNDPRIMAFVVIKALGAPTGQPQRLVRIFVTVDNGKEWVEINPPTPCQAPMTDGSFFVGGLAIERNGNNLRLFLGAMGSGEKMVQQTILSLPELRRILAKK